MKELEASCSRRRFLSTIAGAGAAMALGACFAWAADITDSRVDEIVATTIGIDTHNHIDVPPYRCRYARPRH